MNGTVISVLGLLAGLAVGLALAVRLGRGDRGRGPQVDPQIARLEAQLALHGAEVRRLADSSRGTEEGSGRIRSDLAEARRALESLIAREEMRREHDSDTMEAVRRISVVLAGGGAKGRAGENVMREQLSELPPSMLDTDFKVNGKTVEFALRLPDGRRLPVDSKWSADAELEALDASEDPSERDRLSRAIERIVATRAKEVAAYLDASLTAPVAVAAVPDAAYQVIRRAHAEAFSRGVVIVPYSWALPVLLFMFGLVSRYGDRGDVVACLAEIGAALEAMGSVLENKIARATTMLSNGTDELRSGLGKARGSMARAGAVADDPLMPAADPGLPAAVDRAAELLSTQLRAVD